MTVAIYECRWCGDPTEYNDAFCSDYCVADYEADQEAMNYFEDYEYDGEDGDYYGEDL